MSRDVVAGPRAFRAALEEARIAGPRRVLSKFTARGQRLELPTALNSGTASAARVRCGWPSLIRSADPDYESFVVDDGSGRLLRLAEGSVLAVGEAPFDVLLAGLDFLGASLDEHPETIDEGSVLALLDRTAPGDCAYSRAHRLLVLGHLYATSARMASKVAPLIRSILERPLVETHLGGNHVLRELRSAVTIAAVTGSGQVEALLRRFFDEALRQFSTDGGHLERSAFYHLQAWSDLRAAISVSESVGLEVPMAVLTTESSAYLVLEMCTTPDGRLLGFHDSWRVHSPVHHSTADYQVLIEGLGLFAARRGRWNAYLDCGSSAPQFPVGHLHGSNLGAEIWLGSTPIVVDPGVSTYTAGARRAQERSDGLHNGPRTSGSRRLYTRGSFRTGRPATCMVSQYSVAVACASVSANTESRSGPPAQRSMSVTPEGVTISDRCDGGAAIVLHTGGNEPEQISSTSWRIGPALLDFDGWHTVADNTEFGKVLRAETSRSSAQFVVTSVT